MLAAVSGGIDSTALVLVLDRLAQRGQLPGGFAIAHVDHGVHGQSRIAARHVARLARARSVGFLERRLPLPTPRGEQALRIARYAALKTMADEAGARLLLTAHHADDDLETVLFRFLRGAGPRALAGIPAVRQADGMTIARPLLPATRRELHDLVGSAGEAWVEDPTNRDPGPTRNRIRLQLLPGLRERHGEDIDRALRSLAAHAHRCAEHLERGAQRLLAQRCTRVTSWRFQLTLAGLPARARPFLEEALRSLLQELTPGGPVPWPLVRRATDLRAARPGTQVEGPGRPSILRTRNGLLLMDRQRARHAGTPDPIALPDGMERFAETEWWVGRVRTHRSPFRGLPDPWRVWLDPDAVPEPWRLRSRRPGDRFHPLGRAEQGDLRSFLQRRHVPRCDRDRMPLVVDAEDRVIWIPGIEVSHHARLRRGSRRSVELGASLGFPRAVAPPSELRNTEPAPSDADMPAPSP